MKNFICEGGRIQVTTPSGGYTSGNGYLVGSKFCVALNTSLEGITGVLLTEGVFELAKATGAVTIGQRLFWDDTNKVITTVALANTLVGYAYSPAASADATVQVLVTDNSTMQVAAVAAFDATSLATLKASGDALILAMKTAGIMANA